MKEKYISPELELLCLAPQEALASNQRLEFGSLFYEWPLGNVISNVDAPIDDDDVEIPLIK